MSQGGSRYFMTIIDDFSRYIEVHFLKQKSEAFEKFREFVVRVEKQTGGKVRCIRSDNGKEYINENFRMFLKNNGIRHETTVPYTPEQNGVAERANRTIEEMARCMLLESNLPQYLWSEAVNTAVYIRNRCVTKVLKNKTPYECWNNRKPSVHHFRIFGCEAVVLKKHGNRSKFLPKGEKTVFVGYADNSKGYRLYDSENKRIIIARDVIFFENDLLKMDHKDNMNVDIFKENVLETDNTNMVNETKSDDENTEIDENVEKRLRGRPRICRTGNVGKPKKQYITTTEVLNFACDLPSFAREAMKDEKWKSAMQAEYNALMENEAWILVDAPENRNIIGCRWVFAKKYDGHGNIEKYKARLVAQGFSQKPGEDYFETYSPVVRHPTIRVILALAVHHQLLVNHLDVTTAYLNGKLLEDIYMSQPKGFEDKKQPEKVCKLIKSIYGLKQSGRYWNETIDTILKHIGFRRCSIDSCVYVMFENDELNILSIYVDDIILACISEATMNKIIGSINAKIKVVNKGPIKYYLGIEVNRKGTRGEIEIHQSRYVADLLARWNMTECKGASTPFSIGTVLEKCMNENCNGDEYLRKEYQSLIGCLTYLAAISRPDISHTTSKLAQFHGHPHNEHFVAAKRVLRYLKQKPKGTITYKPNEKSFICFTDADWASDTVDRKSYSGYGIFFAGGLVAWESKKQSVVSLSTMEAEYIAMSNAARELAFLRSLVIEMGLNQHVKAKSKIFCDNQSAVFSVKNPVVQKRSKHIDIKFHHIREIYMNEEVDIQYVQSSSNAADVFTKNLSAEKHHIACELLELGT